MSNVELGLNQGQNIPGNNTEAIVHATGFHSRQNNMQTEQFENLNRQAIIRPSARGVYVDTIVNFVDFGLSFVSVSFAVSYLLS